MKQEDLQTIQDLIVVFNSPSYIKPRNFVHELTESVSFVRRISYKNLYLKIKKKHKILLLLRN